MNTIIALCAIIGGALSAPSAGYANHYAPYAQVPVIYQVRAPAPVAQPIYVSQPVLATKEVRTGPIITGTLHHSQDTYGQYKYGYSSSDGQEKEEAREMDGDVAGKYSFTSPEGNYIALSYEAGQGGFQASGDHLPVAPEPLEMPEELAAAYKESNDRLAQAYEEARLRGDLENPDDGSYKEKDEGSEESKGQETEAKAPSAPAYQLPVFQAPAYQAPAFHFQAPAYQVQQPIYQIVKKVIAAPAQPTYQAYAPAVVAAPVPSAYPTNTYYTAPAPAQAPTPAKEEEKSEEKEEKSKEPVPYLQTSYSTEIGGVPASVPIPAAPAAPAPTHTHNGYY